MRHTVSDSLTILVQDALCSMLDALISFGESSEKMKGIGTLRPEISAGFIN